MRLFCALLLFFAADALSIPANETLWGAYRPNLYFGLRPRLPKSLMTGLVWFGTQDYQAASSESEYLGIELGSQQCTRTPPLV
jgi:mannosyl-oligosaccharide glucosidase